MKKLAADYPIADLAWALDAVRGETAEAAGVARYS